MLTRRASRLLLLCSLFALPSAAPADLVRVAVASNFAPTLAELSPGFERRSGHRLSPSAASTGKHYAQILAGAPFDVLLAADAQRPALLLEAGHAVAGSRFTYALGRLVLWRPAGLPDARWTLALESFLRNPGGGRLALANPRLAPYGMAAREALRKAGYWEALGDRLVLGENVAQAFLFVDSGNAEVGLLAASQLLAREAPDPGRFALLPAEAHPPIEQQAVQLSHRRGAREFLAFLRSEKARRTIVRHGYELP